MMNPLTEEIHNSVHMRRRVMARVCVCGLSVTSPAPISLVSMVKTRYTLGFSSFSIRGFSMNPSVQKLWCEKPICKLACTYRDWL